MGSRKFAKGGSISVAPIPLIELWLSGLRVDSPPSRHRLTLLGGTLDTLEVLGPLPEQISVYLDRGYDSETTVRNCGPAPNAGAGHRLLDRLLRGGRRGASAHPASLDSLPLGGPSSAAPITFWHRLF